jgi:hypothetical protein
MQSIRNRTGIVARIATPSAGLTHLFFIVLEVQWLPQCCAVCSYDDKPADQHQTSTNSIHRPAKRNTIDRSGFPKRSWLIPSPLQHANQNAPISHNPKR